MFNKTYMTEKYVRSNIFQYDVVNSLWLEFNCPVQTTRRKQI